MKVWPEILDFLIKSHSAPLYELSSKYSEKNLPATNGLFGTNCPMYIFYTYYGHNFSMYGFKIKKYTCHRSTCLAVSYTNVYWTQWTVG